MMKQKKRFTSIAVAILYLVGAVLCVTKVIPLVMDSSWKSTYMRPIILQGLIIDASCIVLLPLMALLALRQKKATRS